MHIVSQLVSGIVSESSNDPFGVFIAVLMSRWRLGLFECNASAIELKSKVGPIFVVLRVGLTCRLLPETRCHAICQLYASL
jgi:hypothetical protein